MIKKILLLLFFLTISACSPKEPAEKVANDFIHLYYQNMDQQAALEISSMMAKDKLEDELRLVQSSRASNPLQASNKAKVNFKLDNKEVRDDMGFLSYTLTIQPNNSSPYDRGALITVQKENESWKVINFEEISK